MRFIVVDTADARGSVAVFENGRSIRVESHSTDEDYSSWLLPAVHRVLVASGLTLSQLDGYAGCAGPGSFFVSMSVSSRDNAAIGFPVISYQDLTVVDSSSEPVE